jgi:hypothetical protein
VQVYDADGATNSLNSDPSLQATATTCYITTASQAFNSAEDLGYGRSRGYYQPSTDGYADWYADGDDGADTNSGGTWATAFGTLGKFNDVAVAGDTLACVGTFVELLAPTMDGVSGNKIVFIDSLRFTDGINLTQPDTVWTAIVTRNGTANPAASFGNANYFTIIGFHFTNTNGDNFTLSAVAYELSLYQCKFSDFDGYGLLMEGLSDYEIISCLFLGDGVTPWAAIRDATGTGTTNKIYNNTIYGSWAIDGGIRMTGSASTAWDVRNNIVVNTSGTADDHAVEILNSQVIDTWDYNIYQAGIAAIWGTTDSTITTLAGWQTWVQANGDVDGATNSLNQDPALKATATSCYIDYGDAVTPVDLGYGATGAAVSRRRFIRIN